MPSDSYQSRPGLSFWLPLCWIVFVTFSAITAGLWPVPAFDAMDWENVGAAPGSFSVKAVLQHAPDQEERKYVYRLGTDTMGRDMVSRLVHGARVSMSVGLLSPLIGFVVGGLLGCAAGYYRGRVEALIVGAMDVVLAFPGLVLLLAIAFYLGPSLKNLTLTLGFLTIPAFCRVARAKALVLSEQEFVLAARLTGAGESAILAREIIPNVIVPLAAYGLLVVAFMIMIEGALSFLGLGVPAPVPSWGGMIAEGREVLGEAPRISMIPAGVMFLTVLSFNLIGDHLRNRSGYRRHQL